MNEAQTRFNKIDPKLRNAGWGIVPGSQILVEQSAYIDSGKLHFRLLRKKHNVCHSLQSVNHRHDVLLALQLRKLGMGVMRLADVVFHSLHVAAVCKEGIARWANLVGVGIMSWFQQFACQPVTVAPRKRKALDICPKFISCYCCHFNML